MTSIVPLFVYAELERPGESEPAVTFGELRRRGEDGAARFAPVKSVIHGQLHYITLAELHDLDQLEAPEYERVNIVVYAEGTCVSAWAYAYGMNDFYDLPVIQDGRFPGPEEG